MRSNTLYQYRHKHDLSQAALAARVGCHPDTIYKLEHDLMKPTVPMARRIAEVLNCHIDDLWPPVVDGSGSV